MNAEPIDIQLVVFDLGQVLVRVCDGWSDACGRLGIRHDDRSLDRREAAVMNDIVRRWDSGGLSLDQFAEEVAPLRGISAADVIRIHQNYLLGTFPGAVELIDELSSQALATACLSNTNAGHWQQMQDRKGRNFFPLDRFTFRFPSHLIGACKPDENIYRHVEEETRTKGGQIIFFDDRPENVDVAMQRGWKAHVIAIDGDPVKQIRQHLRTHRVLNT